MSTVVPVMRPFIQMLWAAVTSQPAGKEKTFKNGRWISRARIQTPLTWLKAFSKLRLTSLPRLFLAAEPLYSPTVAFDASTTGGGAWLLCDGTAENPERYLAVTWTADDEKLLGTLRGDPASQAIWEAYAMVLALATWMPFLPKGRCKLELRGDAQGVLQSVLARRAKCPQINKIIAETQLILGSTMYDLYAAHVWSEHNDVADCLSRLDEGAQVPDECAKATRDEVIRPVWAFLGSPYVD